MNRPMTPAVESEISNYVAVAQGDREMSLSWDHDGGFTAADKRRIVAALRGCDPADVDATARECVLELGERCEFETRSGSRTRLTKPEKKQILTALREVGR